MVEKYVVKRTTMPQYGECEYWDERYTREPAAFDWYQGYAGLSAILQHVFPMHASLLQVGVGSSRLQEDMVRAGWQRIVNVDYSKVVISHMAELHKGIPALEYRVADVRDMSEFADASFDGVIDKGTLDAILCGERSNAHAVAMVAQCFRVLRPGSAFMLVTYGDPISRLPYLEDVSGWEVVVYALTKQEVVEALEAEPVVRPLIKGPYPATNVDCMDALSGLEGMHFVYVCRKYDGGEESTGQCSPTTTTTEPGLATESAFGKPQTQIQIQAEMLNLSQVTHGSDTPPQRPPPSRLPDPQAPGSRASSVPQQEDLLQEESQGEGLVAAAATAVGAAGARPERCGSGLSERDAGQGESGREGADAGASKDPEGPEPGPEERGEGERRQGLGLGQGKAEGEGEAAAAPAAQALVG